MASPQLSLTPHEISEISFLCNKVNLLFVNFNDKLCRVSQTEKLYVPAEDIKISMFASFSKI